MKLKALLITASAVAVAIPTVAGAAQGGTTRDSITGGGQAFFDMRETTTGGGAGDTIAFQAQRAKDAETGSTDASGQIQVRRRTTGVVKFHGEFDCLVVRGEPKSSAGTAFGSGESRAGVPFELYVEDGGKGQLERDDAIMLFYGESETGDNGDGELCGFDEDEFDAEEDTVALARGNVQVRNRDTSEDAEESNGQSQQAAAPLSLLGL